jgi:hypothetical protein
MNIVEKLELFLINEEFFMGKKIMAPWMSKEKYVEIFINPTKSEIKKIPKKDNEVRFIADSKKKNVYVWDGYSAIHDQVWKVLKNELKDNRKLEDRTLLMGGAINGKFEANVDWEGFTHCDYDDVFYENGDYWRWLEKYFPGVNEFADWVEGHSHR